jgi:rhodanese-related sulfurtransferase
MTFDPVTSGILALGIAFLLYTRFVGKTSSKDARALVASGGRLLDVRSTGEFAGKHIEGAINIPVDQLAGRIAELGSKDTAIVVYCLSGARSGRAASLLRAQGFTTVADLGPMSRW